MARILATLLILLGVGVMAYGRFYGDLDFITIFISVAIFLLGAITWYFAQMRRVKMV